MKNIITLLFIMMMGCGLNQTVNDPEFEVEYLQPFLQQAEAYGINTINTPVTILYVTELIVNGDDVAGNADTRAGTITFNTSHEYWNSEAKIILIYHELAHYYLNKVHLDESVSCDVPFSIMSLWSKDYAPQQYDYWVSGQWRELEDYYMEEIFKGSHVWYKYPQHGDIISHELAYPCWN